METLPRAGAGPVPSDANVFPIVVFGVAIGILSATLVLWAFFDFKFKGTGKRQ